MAEQYEPDVCNAINAIVKPGWVCVDVGAFKGIITNLLAKLVGGTGHIFAFEAYPGSIAELKNNIILAGNEEVVTVENVAVSDKTGDKIPLYPGRNRWMGEWNIVGHDVEGNKTEQEMEVPTTTLDAYCRGFLRLDFVKIDAEGAEPLILSGMVEVLREKRPALIIEFHNDETWSKRGILLDSGYRIYSMKGDERVNFATDRREYHCLALPSEMECCSLKKDLGGAV
jgi:FkbM family methyltransferase